MTDLSTSTIVHVGPWPDRVVEEQGHDPRSPYVERYWLGVLGPTATWLIRRLADRLEAEPEGFELDLAALAAELGVGHKAGANAPFVRTLQRCARFGVVEIGAAGLRVRRRLPPLTAFQVERLPEHLRAQHQREQAACGPTLDELRERARGFALSLFDQGLTSLQVERELHRRAVHPALAHAAVAWAEQHLDAGAPSADPLPPAA
jgi:hypothetical protein